MLFFALRGGHPLFLRNTSEAKEIYPWPLSVRYQHTDEPSDLTPGFPVREAMPVMHVRKRNGALEPVDVNKIVRAVQRSSYGLTHVDAIRVASKTIGGLYDGATTRELDTISIDTAASLIAEEPQYSRLAARLLLATIVKEVVGAQPALVFAGDCLRNQEGVVIQATAEFVQTHARKLNHAIDDTYSDRFEYFGLAHCL